MKYKMPSLPVCSAKRLASRLYVPAKDRALTRQAVPPLTKNRPTAPMLVVSMSDASTGSSQGVPRVEVPAEDSVGRGAEGKREEDVPVQDPGPPR